MSEEEKFILKLESEASEQNAFFAFFYEEDNQDNEHIKTNKDGLIRFACFLLRIAFNHSPKRSESNDNIFPIDQAYSLPQSGVLIHYIKLINQKKSDYADFVNDEKKTWKDKAFIVGCIGIVILFIISGFVGIFTILKWIL